MSVAAMVARMGVSVGIRTPTATVDSYGCVQKSYATSTVTAFVQDRSSTDSAAQGRTNQRNAAVIYFTGEVTVTVDDIIAVPPTGAKCKMYRVTGVRVPDLATWHPECHTIVDATMVMPTEAV